MGYGGFIATGRPTELLTDENLSLTYRMSIKVYGIPLHRFCVPALEVPPSFLRKTVAMRSRFRSGCGTTVLSPAPA